MAENRFKKSVDAATSNTLDNTSDNIIYNIKDNILKNITEKERKGRGGNHTFYLSAEVADALSNLAKKAKKSKSTLVNDILKAVLINEALN
jgi:hypothetical protein